MSYYDCIIVGSGIAGLYTALLAKEQGSVLLVTKGKIDDCNTKFAQGGIAAAIGTNDSPELHFQDTIATGSGLCDEEVVRIMVDEAAGRIADLVNLGLPFDTLDGEVALALESAHSVPRILHAGGDATGKHIEVTLSNRVCSSGIEVLEGYLATKILVEQGEVRGVKALDCHTGSSRDFECRYLILATGGAGQLFKLTTNSEIATGDGVALAFRAGAEVVGMEFFQFHPTVLCLPGVIPFLISEVVRGEGGILRNAAGKRFMSEYAPQAELAPRDVMARSIACEMERTGENHVFLDATHLPSNVITTRFPQIYRFCLKHGLDITNELIPVASAAHYMIGGVKVNSWGETNLAGLFAAGEVANTGVHGANRLASNSLLEVLVFSKRIIEKMQKMDKPTAGSQRVEIYHSLKQRQPTWAVTPPNLSALQQLLWDEAGIIRSEEGLARAADTLAIWQRSLSLPIDRPSHELSNLILIGRLLIEAALLRQESRGTHFRSDFSRSLPEWRRHIVFTAE